jgi:hypothetical protein
VKRLLLLAFGLLFLAAACGSSDGTGDATAPIQERPTASPVAGRPSAVIDPRSGPPGTDVTVTGTGWPVGAQVIVTAGSPDARPYTTVIADGSGSFRARFFLESRPDGSALETGRLDIFAAAGETSISIPFLVEVRRPVSGPSGPGG